MLAEERVGGIGENEVKALFRGEAEGIAAGEGGGLVGGVAEAAEDGSGIEADGGNGVGLLFDKKDLAGTAGERLEAIGAGACEEVEDRGARDEVAEGGKDPFPHFVGGRAHPFGPTRLEGNAPCPAAGDSHGAGLNRCPPLGKTSDFSVLLDFQENLKN